MPSTLTTRATCLLAMNSGLPKSQWSYYSIEYAVLLLMHVSPKPDVVRKFKVSGLWRNCAVILALLHCLFIYLFDLQIHSLYLTALLWYQEAVSSLECTPGCFTLWMCLGSGNERGQQDVGRQGETERLGYLFLSLPKFFLVLVVAVLSGCSSCQVAALCSCPHQAPVTSISSSAPCCHQSQCLVIPVGSFSSGNTSIKSPLIKLLSAKSFCTCHLFSAETLIKSTIY